MTRFLSLAGLCGFLLIAGCRTPPTRTRIDLITYDEAGQQRRHYTEFRRAAYRMSPGGRVELVLRSERPSSVDPTQTVHQVMYIRCFWNPQPERTTVDSSQIDARVQYALLTPPTGVRYDGAAMVTWRYDKRTKKLAGWIESGTLTPRFRMGEALEPFGPANFSGTFVAEEKPGEVVETAQAMEYQFDQPVLPAAAPVPN
ncbi:MAG TPA: hypothetical protein PKG54_07325 [Phycisphaerae bacterium]|jgi:hypothetical protein|nr:hypothetical protein [Phycisphaerae bacterium]HOB74321.1 hypothetical protein [Phycisphaerae bacterium]HOJ53088.1 hypothetical protein [Phycisphaerae bacterium]HOL24825.1 hypothetical protein [Phycisphaerae bacterium]HPP19361.1 hypothetical protein [Phycisphaerae bacterium]